MALPINVPGIDIAKLVFHVVGMNDAGVVRHTSRRLTCRGPTCRSPTSRAPVLGRTRLQGVNLRAVKDPTPAQLQTAQTDAHTQLPDPR